MVQPAPIETDNDREFRAIPQMMSSRGFRNQGLKKVYEN